MTDPHVPDASQVPPDVLATVDLAAEAAAAYGRPDLAARLDIARRRLTDPTVRVLVVGEFKKGKSTLINSLVGAEVCPVDDDVATTVPTVVRGGLQATAAVFLEPEAAGGDATRVDVAIDGIADYVSERGNPENHKRVRSALVEIPRDLLAGGLAMIDTPGVGGLGSAHQAVTVGVLPHASAVLFVTDASQELTGPELEFLRTASGLCPTIVCVLAKVDFYPEWRRIADLDAAHLARAGLAVPIIPVSSSIRQVAIAQQSKELNEESGYPRVVALLRDFAGNAQRLAVRAAMHDVTGVAAQIEGTFVAERDALADPQRGVELVAELERARERADVLKTNASRWSQTLGDGFADLSGDLDHDLRLRTRGLLDEAETGIDAIDPADAWEEFRAWFTQRAAAEVSENYALLARRADELAADVADRFREAEAEITVPLRIEAPAAILEGLELNPSLGVRKQKAGEQGLFVLRNAYGGMAMFGMLFSTFGRMAGAAASLANPVSIVMGLLMGGKALRDQKQRELQMRRQQGKAAARRYIDDISLHVGKDFRDTMRRLQRELRDGFTARAEEIFRSSQDALASAQRAVQSDQATRAQRLPDVEAELERLAALRRRALHFAPELERP